MHPTPPLPRSQVCFTPVHPPAESAQAEPGHPPVRVATQAPDTDILDTVIDVLETPLEIFEEAPTEILEEAPVEVGDPSAWAQSDPRVPELPGGGGLRNRAKVWTVLKDFARELAYSFRDAYATFRREGVREAVCMWTSHVAQLFVGSSAFFIFNLGRRLHAIWQRLHGRPVAG